MFSIRGLVEYKLIKCLYQNGLCFKLGLKSPKGGLISEKNFTLAQNSKKRCQITHSPEQGRRKV